MSQETDFKAMDRAMTKCEITELEDADYDMAKSTEKEGEAADLFEQAKAIPKEMMEDGNDDMVWVFCSPDDVLGDKNTAGFEAKKGTKAAPNCGQRGARAKETPEVDKESSNDRASDLDEKVGSSKKAPETASKNGKAETVKEENESSDDHGSDSVEQDAKATPMREVKAEATKEALKETDDHCQHDEEAKPIAPKKGGKTAYKKPAALGSKRDSSRPAVEHCWCC